MQINIRYGWQSLNKKAFTLIELLAVIIILAVIALIAVPIVLNIIGSAKNQSSEMNAKLYLDGVEKAILQYNLASKFSDTTCHVIDGGDLSCDGLDEIIKIEMNNSKQIKGGGVIVVSNKKISSVTNLQISGETFETDSNGKLVIARHSNNNTDNTSEGQEVTNNIWTDSNSNGLVDIGDEVKIGEEEFYVISNSNNLVNLLTKNLMCNNNSIIKQATDDTPNSEIIKTDFLNPIDVANNGVTNSIINSSAESYVSYLKLFGVTASSSGLMTLSDVNALGCEKNSYCPSAISWIYSDMYWLGTYNDDIQVMIISSDGRLTAAVIDSSLPIRLKVTVPLNEITKKK